MAYTVKQKQIATLEFLSWSASARGEHYYGYICYYDANGEFKKIQLDYPMTKAQAAALNKKDGYGSMWEEGEPSTRYWTKEAVEADAVKYFLSKLVPEGVKMLQVGNFAGAYPQRVIAWADDYGDLAIVFNALAEKGDRFDWDWSTEPISRYLDDLCECWNVHIEAP